MGEHYGDEPPKLVKKALGPFFIAGSLVAIVWDEAGGNRLIGKGKRFLEGLIPATKQKDRDTEKP